MQEEHSQQIEYYSEPSLHISTNPPEFKTKLPSNVEKKDPRPDSKILLEAEAEEKITIKGGQDNSPLRKKKFNLSKKQTARTNKVVKRKISGKEAATDFLSILSKKTKVSVNKVTDKIRRESKYKNFTFMEKFHYSIIGDAAYYYQKEDTRLLLLMRNPLIFLKKNLRMMIYFYILLAKIIKKFRAFCANLIECVQRFVPLPSPNSPFKILWDLFLVVATIIELFVFSVEKTFFIDLNFGWLGKALLVAFYFDIALSMNTKIFKEGVQISDRILIIKNLFKKKLVSDIIPCFFLSLSVFVGEEDKYQALKIALALKVYTAKKLMQRVKDLIIRNDTTESFYNLCILLVKIFFWGHLFACLWHYIGFVSGVEFPEENNWIRDKAIENKGWKEKYLFAMYWGLTTMLTVGYGDITPTNNREMLFNILAMFLGCGIFGYSMNKIGEILNRAYKRNSILTEQMSKVSFMLREKNLPLGTQTRVKKYLKFVWKQEQKEDPEHEQLIMGKLSSELRDEIFFHTNVNYLHSVPAFKNFSQKTLISLARHMRKVRYSPEQFVYKAGEFDTLNLFIVIEGTLKLMTPLGSGNVEKNVLWKEFKKGDFFGLDEMFTGAARSFSVLSADFSTLFRLSRSDLVQVLKTYPEDYEKFCEIKDFDLLYSDKSQYKIKCDSCSYHDHNLLQCNFFKYKPNKFRIIADYKKKLARKYKRFKRKNRKEVNAMVYKNENTRYQQEFLEVYEGDEDLHQLVNLYSINDIRRTRIFVRRESMDERSPCENLPRQESMRKPTQMITSPLRSRKRPLNSSVSPKNIDDGLNSNLHLGGGFEHASRNIISTIEPVYRRISLGHESQKSDEKLSIIEGEGIESSVRNEPLVFTFENFTRQQSHKKKHTATEPTSLEELSSRAFEYSIHNNKFNISEALNSVNDQMCPPGGTNNSDEMTSKFKKEQEKGTKEGLRIDSMKSYQYYFPRHNVQYFIRKLNI